MSTARKFVAVILMALLNFFNGTDRYVVGGLLVQLSSYYDIDDATSGLLQTVYIIVYVLVAPVFGYLGDRYNRKWLLVGSSLVWVALILASSFVPSNMFWLFLVLRAFSGLGDAAINILAPSLMGDLFTGRGRSYSLMVFFYAPPFGWSASMVIASQIVDAKVAWQWGLRAVPPFGIVAILILLFVLQEPERTEVLIDKHSSLWEDVKSIMTTKSFLLMLVAICSINIVTGAQGWWNPSMIQFAMNSTGEDYSIFHGESYSLIQSIVGVDNTGGGIAGTTLSVWLSEIWTSKGLLCLPSNVRATPLVGAIGTLLATPSTMFVQHLYLMDINWNYVVGFYGSVMSFGAFALSVNILLRVICPTRRATAMALFNTIGSIFGDAPAPYVVGAIADSVRNYNAEDQPGDHLNALLFAFYFSNAFMAVCSAAFLASAFFIEADEIKAKEHAAIKEKAAYSFDDTDTAETVVERC